MKIKRGNTKCIHSKTKNSKNKRQKNANSASKHANKNAAGIDMGIIYAGLFIIIGAIILMVGYCLGCDDKTKQFRDEGLYIPPQRKK